MLNFVHMSNQKLARGLKHNGSGRFDSARFIYIHVRQFMY